LNFGSGIPHQAKQAQAITDLNDVSELKAILVQSFEL